MKIWIGFTVVNQQWKKWTKFFSSRLCLEGFSFIPSIRKKFFLPNLFIFQIWCCWNIFQARVRFWVLFAWETFHLSLVVGFVHLIIANSGIFFRTGCLVSLKHLVLATVGGEINVSQTCLKCFWAQRGAGGGSLKYLRCW